MIRVVSIGTDRRVFEAGSAVRERLRRQATLFTELHVIVFSLRASGLRMVQEENLWLYPTNSLIKMFYLSDAITLARGLIGQRGMDKRNAVITTQDPFECGVAGMVVSRLSGKFPLQVQVHTDFLNSFFKHQSLLNWLRVFVATRVVLPYAHGVRVVSERIAHSIRERGIRLRRPLTVLPVFDNLSKFSVSAGSFNLHDRYGRDSCVVLMACRLAPEKDLSRAVEVFRRVQSGTTSAHLVIVGDGEERSRVLREIQEHGLKDSIHVEPWQSNLGSYYASADAFLVTSRFEGYGLVFLEAALSGCPIVCTDVGIAREIIPSSYQHFICPVEDTECLATRVQELAKNKTLRREYGDALRVHAKKFVISENDYFARYRDSLESIVTAAI